MRKIDRPEDARFGLDELHHVLLVKRMVAKRDTIRPRLKQPLCMCSRQPHAIAGILAIDHNKIEPPRIAQTRQMFGHSSAPRAPHDITQK